MGQWYVRDEGADPIGPVDEQAVVDEIKGGRVTPEWVACPVGGQEWKPVKVHPPFAQAFAARPGASSKPPMPPIPKPVALPPSPVSSVPARPGGLLDPGLPAAGPTPSPQPSHHPAPVGQSTGPGKKEKDKESRWGVSLKPLEVLIDKTLDIVLIFLGLYMALAVQDCQDQAKDRADYVKLLESFKTEVTHNAGEKKSIEKDIGPISKKEPGDNLGPMEARFEEFRKTAAEADTLFGCLHLVVVIAGKGTASSEQQQKLVACEPVFKAAEKDEDAGFKPISMSPLYRDDVWQLYLANGIRYFENKDLAIKIGAIYSKLKVIEKAVAEIEAMFNDRFGESIGEAMKSVSELEDIMPDDASEEETMRILARKGPVLEAKLKELSAQMKQHKYAATGTEAMIELKVQRLKGLLEDVEGLFASVQKDIDTELARVK